MIDRPTHLIDLYNLEHRLMQSPLLGDNIHRSIFGGGGYLPVNNNFPPFIFV
jgi:6-phosphofructokinase 1